MSLFQFDKIVEWIPYLFKGLGVTLLIALVAAIFGLIIAIILTAMRSNKLLQPIATAYIDLFRGTPIILQLSIVYFAIPQLLDRILNDMMHMGVNLELSGMIAAYIAFSLNSAAYISEIIRSGINSVDKGELEAANALGISKFHTYKDIILPIAFRNAFPALMNEFILLVKDSSIVSIIGIPDLMRRQQIVTSQTFMYFEPLIVIGVIYYTVVKILSFIGKRIEVKLAL